MNDRKVNPLVIIFMIVQLIFLIIIIFIFYQFYSDPYAKDAQGDYINQPELEIVGLDNDMLNLTDKDVQYMQRNIFKVAQNNTPNINKNIKAEVRNESIKNIHFEKSDFRYLRAILDLPELEQSYEIFYGYPNFGDDIYNIALNDSIFILCLDDSESIKYPDSKCANAPYTPERTKLGAELLHEFNFNYFSTYIEPAEPNKIIINPSVTYENDEATKNSYINEVKMAIDSLGISPDIFTYYVRTTSDVNYYN